MTRMMAPITPYLAEELNESMTKSETSVFEQQWHPQVSPERRRILLTHRLGL